MPLLSINLDMVAAMREIRRTTEPDPAQAAVLAEINGVDGITVQVRRDRKYIRDRDLYILKGVVKSRLTIEMPPVDDIIEKAMEIKPWMVTLVADHADSTAPVSTIDFNSAQIDFSDLTARFSGVGINTCFFVEPENDQIKKAAKNGAAAVLINCSGYTGAMTTHDAQFELDRIDKAAQFASKHSLEVHCGRGLNHKNITPLVEIKTIDEFVVGHAIFTRALLVGLEQSIKEMATVLHMYVQ
jgi:pyridoxine 5-phosphate synthase